MSDMLIIAPTHGYKRGPLMATIDDTIKDNPNAIRTKQNLTGIIPKGAVKTQARIKTGTTYFDPTVIRILDQHQEDKGEQIFFMDTLLEHHPMVNISFPDVNGTNSKYIKGLSNT